MRHAVVIQDLSGALSEGEILTGNAVGVAAARGVALLPVEADLLRRGALSGWAKRAFGKGWRYDEIVAARGCPLVLHLAHAYSVIEWKARLVSDGTGFQSGSLRLAPDTAQAGAGACGLSPEVGAVQLSALGEPDAEGGWVIGGRSRVSISADILLGLQLYGQASGVRVLWFAASQTV